MTPRRACRICIASALLAACAIPAPGGRAATAPTASTSIAAPPGPAAATDSATIDRSIDAELRRILADTSAATRDRRRARIAELRVEAPWLPYYPVETDRPVRGAPNSPHPRYPAELKAASVQGEVQAQFVVDANGVAEMWTLKVLRSSHGLFTEAVREALPTMRFVPAEVRGRPVRSLVQQPFQFALSR